MVRRYQCKGNRFSTFVMLSLIMFSWWNVNACQLFRRRNDTIVDWLVCTSCISKLECCQLHFDNDVIEKNVRQNDYCVEAIAQFPTMQEKQTEFSYSLFRDTAHNVMIDQSENHISSFRWEKLQSDTETWTTIPHHPFQDDNDIASSSRPDVSVRSTVSTSGGMHRLWNFRLSARTTDDKSKISILVFLTSNVFVDVEDWIVEEPTNNHAMVQLQTENLIDIEAPSMYSPQHVLVLNVNFINVTEQNNDDFEFNIRLHLRYLTPSTTTRTTILLPPPLILNSYDISEQQQQYLALEASRGRSSDLWLAWSVTLVCSILSSLILLKDLFDVCRWN